MSSGRGSIAVRLKNAMRDPYSVFPAISMFPRVSLRAKPVAHRQGQRLLPGSAGMKDRLVDVEKDELDFHEMREGEE